jgi:Fe-Mn family superoxide dismutase
MKLEVVTGGKNADVRRKTIPRRNKGGNMEHKLPDLPYSRDSLSPMISAETMDYHYGKHHAAYVANLNKLIKSTEFENMALDEIIKKAGGGIFNNAAQHWNHSFYWHCMTPKANAGPTGDLRQVINRDFGSFERFKELFATAGTSLFGSGWVWLVDNNGSLSIVSGQNAANPMTDNKKPLLVMDVWEHAYYIDYRNLRADYIANYLKLVNWQFVMDNFSKHKVSDMATVLGLL